MRHRWWLAALCTTAVLGSVLPSQALGIKDLWKKGGKKEKEQIASCVRRNAWMAYFQGNDGALAPVRDTLNTDNDEDWMGLRFIDYEGPRIRLGVLKVINKSAESEQDENGWTRKIEVPVSGIQELLTVALYNTRRFDVIEQKRIEEVLAQQKRADTQEPSPTTIGKVGQVLGAQYLVYGTVNEWNPERGSRSMESGSILNRVRLKTEKAEAEVAITFMLTDIASGQNIFTTSERARIGEWGFGFGAAGGSGTTSQKAPVNYAVQACANKAAFKIAAYLRDRKWRGTVVDIKGADIFINAGSQQGMALQTRLSVQSVRGIVKDGATVLGEDLRGIGTLEVISVQTGFSIARVVEGCKGMKKGDRVELATHPVLPPPIPECAALDTSQFR